MIKQLETYGIIRDCSIYTTHWKEKLISLNVIKPSSLTFQEDEALIYSLLKFPDPVSNWSTWSTLSLYCMKLYTSVSSAGLNLFRGFSGTRQISTPAANVEEYCSDINHPGPSLTTNQRNLPPLTYEGEVFHRNELRFHLAVMQKNDESLKLIFPKVVRFLGSAVVDEQEINQGVFIHDGKLYGLKNPVSIDDLRRVGVSNLSEYISTENDFIISVREYRLTDFNGYMCTNVNTTFENAVLQADACSEKMQKVVEYTKTCLSCLHKGLSCEYTHIHLQCSVSGKWMYLCEFCRISSSVGYGVIPYKDKIIGSTD